VGLEADGTWRRDESGTPTFVPHIGFLKIYPSLILIYRPICLPVGPIRRYCDRLGEGYAGLSKTRLWQRKPKPLISSKKTWRLLINARQFISILLIKD
jgi:hypothetical protein